MIVNTGTYRDVVDGVWKKTKFELSHSGPFQSLTRTRTGMAKCLTQV